MDDTQARRTAFGKRLRVLRAMTGFTSQESLALKAGVDRSFLSGIESGRRSPSIDVVFRLADALGVPAAALFEPADSGLGASSGSSLP